VIRHDKKAALGAMALVDDAVKAHFNPKIMRISQAAPFLFYCSHGIVTRMLTVSVHKLNPCSYPSTACF